jgi:endonuclease/exonuclease/phosphatase (EEP) superfamily protein YafD
MGDLNTWQPNAERKTLKLFQDAAFTTPFGSHTTFLRKIFFVPIDLRLDWIWIRGLEATSYGIDRKITISDHFPLWATLKISQR